jgi:molybdopterin molybdotransferase
LWADGLVDVPPATPIRHGEPVRYLPYGDLLY